MKDKDILTEEEMKETRHYNPSTTGCYKVDERAIAQAQIDKLKRLGRLKDELAATGITCPFCGQDGYDKMGLKHHLNFSCNSFYETEDI